MEQRKEVLDFYRQTGTYTYAGEYGAYYKSLPDDVSGLGKLMRNQMIHRVILEGWESENKEKIRKNVGDLDRFPWYRMRCEDDIFLTAPSMTAELFRLNGDGFVSERPVEDRLILTCRYMAVMMAAILKAKGIPCRCRAGFGTYFCKQYLDHWVNEYWSSEEQRWIMFDADSFDCLEERAVNGFDVPPGLFITGAQAWLNVRKKGMDGEVYKISGTDISSLRAIILTLFYDYHALMNHEISYLFTPAYADIHTNFQKLSEEDLKEIDVLAEVMADPDQNFECLKKMWETEKKFRQLTSPLVF